MSNHQHGYRKKNLAQHIYLKLSTLRLKLKDQLNFLSLDLDKAFDKVAHKKLLLKMYKYVISGKVLDRIEAF